MPQRLLIVDDDDAILDAAREALRKGEREIVVAHDAASALRALDRWRPDVALCDVRMPDMDGIALLELLGERVPDADVIMMTAYDDMPTVIGAMRAGAVEFLVKPLDLHELRRTFDRLFEDRADRRTSAVGSTAADVSVLVGHDPESREIRGNLRGDIALDDDAQREGR